MPKEEVEAISSPGTIRFPETILQKAVNMRSLTVSRLTLIADHFPGRFPHLYRSFRLFEQAWLAGREVVGVVLFEEEAVFAIDDQVAFSTHRKPSRSRVTPKVMASVDG